MGHRRGLTLLVLLVLMTARSSLALPPPGTDQNSPVSQWYRSLHAPGTGESCCGISDCLDLPVRIFAEHYQVQFNGDWIEVPDDAIIKDGMNPVGHAVSCVQAQHWIAGVLKPRVICFKPMVGT